MNPHIKRAFGVVSTSLLALVPCGCAGFWDPVSSTSTTVTSTSLSSGYFYVLDSTTSQIIAFDIESGTLTELGSYAPPDTPLTISVAPDNEFLLVSTLRGIYSYTISDGALTLNSDILTSDPAVAMQVDTKSEWLIETSATGYINVIPLFASSGELDTSRSTSEITLSSSSVNQISIAPNDAYAFVACGSKGTLAFSFSPSSARPIGTAPYATIAPVSTSGAALSIAVDPSTRLLYIGESAATSSGGGLRTFTIGSSGALAELSGSPRSSGGTGPYAILPKSTGDYVYVANWKGTSTGNVTGFEISASNSTYTVTKLSTAVGTGIQPTSLAEDSNRNFVLAVNKSGSPYFDAYFFDSTTAGQLDTTIISSNFAASALVAQHY